MQAFKKFAFEPAGDFTESYDEKRNLRLERSGRQAAIYGFLEAESARAELQARGVAATGLHEEKLTLEDTFIALTGKY